jgi:hypothetical protein
MNAIKPALYTTLTGGTALMAALATATSVYDSVMPDKATYPAVIFSIDGGGDANDSPRRRVELMVLVKAVSSANAREAGLIDDLVDGVLHNGTLSVSGWTLMSCRRTTDIEYVETTREGARYWHSGALYRVRLNKQ